MKRKIKQMMDIIYVNNVNITSYQLNPFVCKKKLNEFAYKLDHLYIIIDKKEDDGSGFNLQIAEPNCYDKIRTLVVKRYV